MAFWLADQRNGQDADWIQRFDPRFWTVNFPRPMMAGVTCPAPDTLRVDAVFMREGDLAGVIWDSADERDHPLLRYATDRDYSLTRLSFRWRSAGVLPLDAVNGPTLTIEGEDEAGSARTWYVRLWNYAQGAASDARIVLNFSDLASGFLLPEEAQPVSPYKIDRMFISLVAPDFVPGSIRPLTTAATGWVELSEIRCEGHRCLLEIGDVLVPPHGLAIATAYDDCTNQTPQRLIRNTRQLGYRGSLLHYAGMSHFMQLQANGDRFLIAQDGEPLCAPALAWHRAFFTAAREAGFSPILSLSYELFAQYCPYEWQQKTSDGQPGRTGWNPPSALLSPANQEAMAWLQATAQSFVRLMRECDVPVRIQIGEPWWWITPSGQPCLYDDAARAALSGDPVTISDLRQPLDAAQKALLDQAGNVLAASTYALRDAVRGAAAPDRCEVLLLIFLPGVVDPAMPEACRANLPKGWAFPAFNRLQLEDYDWLTTDAEALRRHGYATVTDRLGYPPAATDYLAGFVLDPAHRDLWIRIDQGLEEASARGSYERFVWALPQICRDGFVRLPEPSSEDAMLPFDDVLYPLELGRDASVTAEFSTSITATTSGYERRNSLWSDARLRFDIGPGIRSEDELGVLLAFFRARRGAARGFRLRDPSDFSSNGLTGVPTATDQWLGQGDGRRTTFPIVKRYGPGNDAQLRRITRPRPESVVVSVDGLLTRDFTVEPGGIIRLTAPPVAGSAVRAGFVFEVPVRFAEDRLEISGATFAAGEAPSVPVIEIREQAA